MGRSSSRLTIVRLTVNCCCSYFIINFNKTIFIVKEYLVDRLSNLFHPEIPKLGIKSIYDRTRYLLCKKTKYFTFFEAVYSLSLHF